MLQRWVSAVAENPWLAIVGAAVTLVSFVSSIVFYLKGHRVKSPVWAVRSTSLVQNLGAQYPSLHILYGDSPVDSVTVSRVIVWNEGRETIHGHDIAEGDLVRIEAPSGARLLEAKVVTQNNPANRVIMTRPDDDRSCLLSFDYLDFLDGMILQVVHTGEGLEPVIKGTLKGFGSLDRARRDRVTVLLQLSPRKLLISRLVALIVAMVAGCCLVYMTATDGSFDLLDAIAVLPFLSVYAGGKSLLQEIKPRPKGLDRFLE